MALTLDSLKPIFPKYDYKYTDRPKEACSTYLSEKNPFNLPPASEMEGEQVPPYIGAETNTKAIDWKGKSRGLFFHHPQGNVNVICVKLSEECKSPVPVICRERTKTRCTQTRYRESSAQTRPYLPDVAGDKDNYQHFEVYQISKLLDGYEPPGDYEAKVVERTRRRRRYENALQMVTNDKEKQHTILEAMEWEDWVAREEDIQGCQMLRMEIVERIFQERQEKLQHLSEMRIACSADRIQAKRVSQMKKINVEFARGMRRLEAKKQKITRSYRKGNIIQEHIDPASDLHAPQMRFGVNPNRRHFVGFRKTFDDRIDDLDKQRDERGLAALICPFSKLRSWSKPKQRMREVSQRFCSDENLKNLYESLKGLRTISEAPKANPKCLKKKKNPVESGEIHLPEKTTDKPNPETPKPEREENLDQIDDPEELPTPHEELTENLRKRRANELLSKTGDEMSSILGEFEGTTLGKLLIFLSDELERLKQQKKFQAIQMLAERERWQREATEAGLRQKENKLREDQEKLYQTACDIHRDTASLFLQSVLEEEFNFTSELLAREKITELAKQMDTRDLDSIRLHGAEGRAYERMVIKDYVKNQVFAVAEKRFAKMKAEKLHEAQLRSIEEELYAGVNKALAAEYTTLDSVSIVGELLDELITDAVTYDFDILTPTSSENEFDTEREINEIINKLLFLVTQKPVGSNFFTDSTQFETRLTAEKEARAVIRKMIRRVVPEQRWKEDGDRVVEQTLSETFNEAIYEVECLKASRYVRNNEKLNSIISDIYNRMGGYKKTDRNLTEGSSDSTLSACLRSIRSTIDIFENFPHSDSDDSLGNITLVDEVLQERSMKKIDYIDRSQLEQYEPVEVGRRHERYNIMGKVAKRYQNEECGGVNLQIFGEESDVSHSSTTSNSGLVSYTSQYADLAKSRMFSTPWIRNIHPELSGYEGQDSSDLRMNSSYERCSIGYERLRGSYRRSKEHERRASY